MPSNLSLPPDCRVVEISGCLDGRSPESAQYQEMLMAATEAEITAHTVFDLSRTTYVNSKFLGLLINYRAVSQRAGYQAMLYAPSPSLKNVIQTTGIHYLIPLAANEDEIYARLSQGDSSLEIYNE